MGGMNLGLQKHTIKKKLRNRGINPDRIDLEAELDSTLSLPENIQNLEEKYGRLEREGRNAGARQERAQAQRRKQAKKEARSRFRKLPKYRRYIDKTKNAEKTFRDPTERQMKKWKQNPNQYDIQGVDTRTGPERRPQTELPFNRRRDRILYQGDKSDLRKAFRKKPDWPVGNKTGRLKDPKNPALRSQGKMMNLARSPGSSNVGDPTEFYEEDIKKEREIMRKKRGQTLKMRMLAQSGANVRGYGDKLEAGEDTRASKILKDSREIGTVGKKLRGSTTERSDQESLRDGYVSKKSESTLDKWEDNYI